MERVSGLARPFLVGDIFAFMSQMPLYGDKTFGIAREVAEFLSGLPCPVEDPPWTDARKAAHYAIWNIAILEQADAVLRRELCRQHPPAFRLRQLQVPLVGTPAEEDAAAVVFWEDLKALGIDRDAVIKLTPLPCDVQKLIQQNCMDEDYIRQCCRTYAVVVASQ